MHSIRHENILDDALSLCQIGNRFVGNPGEAEARAYITQRFRQVGLQKVREEPFEVATYRPVLAQCELLGVQSHQNLSCVGLQFTSSGDIEAESVLLGSLETLEDLEKALSRSYSLEGRIAVLRCPYPYIFAETLVNEGAVGIIDISEAPDGHICHLNAMMYPTLAACPNGTFLPVPGVTVERNGADRLIQHISVSSRRVRIVHEAKYEIVRTANVVGELPGYDGTPERAVIGAHYDSQLEGVGASDNASGIGSLIEIGRILASKKENRRSLIFTAFADEEGGFRGSTQYCRQHRDELNNTVGMVNIDAPGWSPSLRSLHADPSIRDFALKCAAKLDWLPDNQLDASSFPGSDHNPFIDAGVPACFFWRNPPTHPYYHTAGDTPDLLDFRIVGETASVAGETLERLGSDANLALGRARPTYRWLDLRPETTTG